jgi:hypothetical protein
MFYFSKDLDVFVCFALFFSFTMILSYWIFLVRFSTRQMLFMFLVVYFGFWPSPPITVIFLPFSLNKFWGCCKYNTYTIQSFRIMQSFTILHYTVFEVFCASIIRNWCTFLIFLHLIINPNWKKRCTHSTICRKHNKTPLTNHSLPFKYYTRTYMKRTSDRSRLSSTISEQNMQQVQVSYLSIFSSKIIQSLFEYGFVANTTQTLWLSHTLL